LPIEIDSIVPEYRFFIDTFYKALTQGALKPNFQTLGKIQHNVYYIPLDMTR